jgi:hypothetical protein
LINRLALFTARQLRVDGRDSAPYQSTTESGSIAGTKFSRSIRTNICTLTCIMKTRAKGPAKAASDETPTKAASKVQLGPESTNPPKIFILPKYINPEARFVTLCHPRTSDETRYLYCPTKGFYEFTKVAAPKKTPRSWLLASPESLSADNSPQETNAEVKHEDPLEYNANRGYVTKTADILIATPVDPLFLILPTLSPPTKSTDTKRLFLSSDDYFDTLTTSSEHFRTIIQQSSARTLFEARMTAVCDTVDAGDESMFRLSMPKLFSLIVQKAKAMSTGDLPASVEEKFIREALRKPMLSLKRGETSHELENEESESSTPKTVTTDSQTTADTAATSFTSETTIMAKSHTEGRPAVPPIDAPEAVPDLLRLKMAFSYITSSYLPSHLASELLTLLDGSSETDFTPLTDHLAHLSALKKEALSTRSMSDFSRKRTIEDEEAGEGRLAKKKRAEEEEKRKKAGMSRGVRDLKKVDVSGMKKMSDFFKKKS